MMNSPISRLIKCDLIKYIRSKSETKNQRHLKRDGLTPIEINVCNLDINDLLSEKETLIQSLQEQIEIKDQQINELLQQQNQSQQIIMSMNQNQKLLVESKRNWIQRLFGLGVERV